MLLVSACLISTFPPDMSRSDTTMDRQFAAPLSLPFIAGERFVTDLTWLAMRAGIATMAVQGHEAREGRPQIQLSLVAGSSPVVTKFYPVDNRVVSTVDVESFSSPAYDIRAPRGKTV